jgi:hypothetical protein
MEIHHRPWRKYADALFRLPHTYGTVDTAMVVHLKDLPCGGCQKCTRDRDSWNTFAEEVDDVVPLAKPGTWTYSRESPESDKEPGRPSVLLYQCYPREGGTGGDHPNRAVLYHVTEKILNPAEATEEPDLDFDCGAMEGGPLRTHARLVVNLRLVVVIRALDEPDGGSFSFVGMSPEEMRESQPRNPDLSQWLSTGEEPVD